MRPHFILFIAAISLVTVSYAQQCNCAAELRILEGKAERNLPAYYDQVILAKRQAVYQKHKAACNTAAASIKSNTECVYLAAKYLSFFRDEHLSVSYKDSYYPFSWDKSGDSARKEFFRKEKRYSIAPAQKYIKGALEGYWRSKDKKYIVQVMKDKNAMWDHVAVIIKGDPQFWSPGQLKFSLKPTGRNTYQSIYLTGNRRPKVYQCTVTGDVMTMGRINIFYHVPDTSGERDDRVADIGGTLAFRELSAKTNYIRVPSFDYELYPMIDSLVKNHLANILSKPNLVIDVRNNDGGGDRSYSALLPLVHNKKEYPGPIMAAFYATPDIIKHYEDIKYRNCETKQDSLDDEQTLEFMKKYKGSFTAIEPDTVMLDTAYTYPLKVAIIMNRWCASSAEGFIMNSRLSKKVKLYGENTWGMVTYGDWMATELPCLPVEVSMPTKKMFLASHEDLESTGIPVQVPLDPMNEEDWVKQVQKDVEQ